MKICANKNINFQRRLKPSEEAEYSDVLKQASKAGKKVLIVPASSLPNKTGSWKSWYRWKSDFFWFRKKILGNKWSSNSSYRAVSRTQRKVSDLLGTSMDLWNHVINLEYYTSEQIFPKNTDRVDFKNIIEENFSARNELLRNSTAKANSKPNLKILSPKTLQGLNQRLFTEH